jgi:hypothetical protein
MELSPFLTDIIISITFTYQPSPAFPKWHTNSPATKSTSMTHTAQFTVNYNITWGHYKRKNPAVVPHVFWVGNIKWRIIENDFLGKTGFGGKSVKIL